MAGVGPQPDCAKCEAAYLATLPFPKNLMSRMIVCSMCGNKRCPRAADHDLFCTGSNEPGQLPRTSGMTAASVPNHGTSNLPMCGACGSTIWPGNFHSCKPVKHPMGWQCPVCGTVYAPTVANCYNVHQPPPRSATGTVGQAL